MVAQADRLARQAEVHRRAGRASAAEGLYRTALELAPGHAASLHGLGALAHASGRADLAIGLIGQAAAAAPEVAHYTISLGLALLDQGHVEEARAALQVAVLRGPDDPRAHRALAQALVRLGRLEEAEASLRVSLRLEPAGALGRAGGLMSLGGVLRARGDQAQAIAALAEAARLSPKDPLTWHTLASAYGETGALAQAEIAFRKVAALLPGDAAAQANLGTALFGLDRLEEAKPVLQRARAMAPRNAATLSSLGLVLMGLGETLESERVLASACREAPASNPIAINHGTALAAVERRDEAEAVFRAVLSRDAANVHARFNFATMLLARGALAEGWAAFEARLGLVAGHSVPLPEWDGSPVQHGRVLIRAEQGLGDSIQFLRWVGLASVRAELVLELPAPLLPLVQAAVAFAPGRVRLSPQGGDHAGLVAPGLVAPGLVAPGLVAPGLVAPGLVAQASLLSLPHLLRCPVPPAMTMRADPDLVRSWTGRLPAGLKIGLAWAGSAAYRFDRQRSLRLAQLTPLAEVEAVSFVSLQQEPVAAPEGMSLFIPDPPPHDLADTAALIASLDLVISVDTMIAHLAASLGGPVWLLDRFGGDWRWRDGFAFGRDWYPGLRRFAQQEPSRWEPVIETVAAALAAFVKERRGAALEPARDRA